MNERSEVSIEFCDAVWCDGVRVGSLPDMPSEVTEALEFYRVVGTAVDRLDAAGWECAADIVRWLLSVAEDAA